MDEPSWAYYANGYSTDAEPHKVRKSQLLGSTIVKGKEVSRFPLIRNEVKPTKPSDKPTYRVGHKQPTSDWLGLIYTLNTAGNVINVIPADRQSGREMVYADNGMVMKIEELGEDGREMAWYPDGLLQSVSTQGKAKSDKFKNDYRLISA